MVNAEKVLKQDVEPIGFATATLAQWAQAGLVIMHVFFCCCFFFTQLLCNSSVRKGIYYKGGGGEEGGLDVVGAGAVRHFLCCCTAHIVCIRTIGTDRHHTAHVPLYRVFRVHGFYTEVLLYSMSLRVGKGMWLRTRFFEGHGTR